MMTPLPTRPLGRSSIPITIFGLGGEGVLPTHGETKAAVRVINRALDNRPHGVNAMLRYASPIFVLIISMCQVLGADAPIGTYHNQHHGFTVSIPDGGSRIDDQGDECHALFLLPPSGVMSCAAVALEKSVNLAQFEKQSMKQQPNPDLMQNLLGIHSFKLISSIDAELGTVKARSIEFTAQADGIEMKGCLYLAVSNGRGFMLMLQAPPDDYARIKHAFLKAVQSFNIGVPDGRTHSEFIHKELGYRLNYPFTWHAITLKKGWTVFCAPENADGPSTVNLLINAMRNPGINDETIKTMADEVFTEFKAKPGISDTEAPQPVTIGNLQGYRYAMTQVAPNKAVVRQQCYSAAKGTRQFTLVCTAPIEKAKANRELFDTILKSLRVDDLPVQIVPYTNERNGFSISYPDNWLLIEPLPSAVGVVFPRRVKGADDLYEGLASIWSDSVDFSMDLERCAAISKGRNEKEKGYHLDDENTVQLNGLKAKRQLFTITVSNIKVKTLRYVTIGRHRQYFLEFTSPAEFYETHANVYDQIAASFKLLPASKDGDTYQLHRIHASFLVPTSWEVWEDVKLDRAAILLNHDKPNAQGMPEVKVSIDLRQEKVSSKLTLKEFTKSRLDEVIKEQKGVKITKNAVLTIDGNDAIETHLSAETPNGLKYLICYTVLANGEGYVFTSTGSRAELEAQAKTVDGIVRSIRFDEPVIMAGQAAEKAPKKLNTDWKLFEETYGAIRDYLGEGEILVPSDLLEKAELGDHFETINLDRPDRGSAFGNPTSHWFINVKGYDGPDTEYGSYGKPDGGGRRLMVTRRSCDFSQAIMICARSGFENKVTTNATKEQTLEIAKYIDMLGSTNNKKQEDASNALLKSGMTAVNMLIDSLTTSKDDQVQSRIRALLQKIHLRAAVDKFRLDHPVKDEKIVPKVQK